MSLESVVFVQQLRTDSSEIWLADISRTRKEAFAQIDIHYPSKGAEVTVTLLRPLKTEDLLHEFLNIIDNEIISLGDLARGDLRFRVIHGGQNQSQLFERPKNQDDDLDSESIEEGGASS